MAALAAATGIAVLIAWGNRRMARRHAGFTAEDVDQALSEFLSPDAPDHDAFDLFLSWQIDDSYLESIRQECLRICRECPPVHGKDMNEEGEQRIAALLCDLRDRAGRRTAPRTAG